MDEDRQIRFLICPFFLYSSLLWWAFVSPETYWLFANLKPDTLKELLPIIAAAGAATLPLGYSIGAITTLFLRACFAVRNHYAQGEQQIYEAWFSKEAYEAILKWVNTPEEDRTSLLYAAATFDHGLLPEGIHKWQVRRWNAFNIASSSAFALFISLLVVPVRILYTFSWKPLCGWDHKLWWWLVTNLFLICALLAMAYFSWHDSMGMVAFQSRRSSFDIGDRDKRPTTMGSTLDCD